MSMQTGVSAMEVCLLDLNSSMLLAPICNFLVLLCVLVQIAFLVISA